MDFFAACFEPATFEDEAAELVEDFATGAAAEDGAATGAAAVVLADPAAAEDASAENSAGECPTFFASCEKVAAKSSTNRFFNRCGLIFLKPLSCDAQRVHFGRKSWL